MNRAIWSAQGFLTGVLLGVLLGATAVDMVVTLDPVTLGYNFGLMLAEALP